MSADVVPFRRGTTEPAKQPERPVAPSGAEVGIYEAEGGGFAVYDISSGGGSAGHHGYYDTRAEAVAVAKNIAAQIGGTFNDFTDGGAL